MSMPKAPIHENHALMLGEGEVGASGKVFPVKPKSVSTHMQTASQQQFRRSVGVSYPAHVEPTLVRC
jgi:hypothetical protein